MTWHGGVWHGEAGLGTAGQGAGMACPGVVGQRSGLARFGPVWHAKARSGSAWHGGARRGMAWRGKARHGYRMTGVFDLAPGPPIEQCYLVNATTDIGNAAVMVQLGEGRLGFWDQIAGIVALLPTAEWESRPSESTDMRKVTHGDQRPQG